jgi:hypothetical protein
MFHRAGRCCIYFLLLLSLGLFILMIATQTIVYERQTKMVPMRVDDYIRACRLLLILVIVFMSITTLSVMYRYIRYKVRISKVTCANNTILIFLLVISIFMAMWKASEIELVENEFAMGCDESESTVQENLALSNKELQKKGFFTTLNTMNSYANEVLCSDKCPCNLKVSLADDYDTD